jgi:hypothetical protein
MLKLNYFCAFNKAFGVKSLCGYIEMISRVFLMNDKLKSLENGKWRNNTCFRLFAERLEALHNNVIDDSIASLVEGESSIKLMDEEYIHLNKQ